MLNLVLLSILTRVKLYNIRVGILYELYLLINLVSEAMKVDLGLFAWRQEAMSLVKILLKSFLYLKMNFWDGLYPHQLGYSQIETSRFIRGEIDEVELGTTNRNCLIRHDPVISDVKKSSECIVSDDNWFDDKLFWFLTSDDVGLYENRTLPFIGFDWFPSTTLFRIHDMLLYRSTSNIFYVSWNGVPTMTQALIIISLIFCNNWQYTSSLLRYSVYYFQCHIHEQ